jgi:hypothetical protein
MHSEKNLLALGVPSMYFDYDHRIPAHVELVKIPQNPYEGQEIPSQSTQFLNPHMYNCRIHTMKIFPDGSRLIVAYSNEKNDSWCKLFTLPESLDDEGMSFLVTISHSAMYNNITFLQTVISSTMYVIHAMFIFTILYTAINIVVTYSYNSYTIYER